VSIIADDDIMMFGAFTFSFILLTIMFGVKLGPIVGLCIGFAGGVVVLVLGMIVFEDITS